VKLTAYFIYKLKIVAEEAGESHYFFELIAVVTNTDSIHLSNEIKKLTYESNEITAIIVSFIKKTKAIIPKFYITMNFVILKP